MSAYYNELDPYAAQWLRNLIAKGLIADGVVDNRSIVEVTSDDLKAFTQVHFFAGIGVWSHALRLAGWPDTRPVWTGSCPCQPFSVAGKGTGFADERHLWPEFFRLIRECRPRVVFGEQVASKDGLAWLDTVYADLETADYATAAVDICAAGVGAPHIRQRLYFVADDCHAGSQGGLYRGPHSGRQDQYGHTGRGGSVDGLADAQVFGRVAGVMGNQDGAERPIGGSREHKGLWLSGTTSASGNLNAGPTNGDWRDADWLYCRDDKWRPVEPSTFPLAHGTPARVGRLRAYGNAIVPQVAQAVIESYMEARP